MEPMLECPDCGEWIAESDFVAHREKKHPPSPISVAAVGAIRSQEAHGYQPTPNQE